MVAALKLNQKSQRDELSTCFSAKKYLQQCGVSISHLMSLESISSTISQATVHSPESEPSSLHNLIASATSSAESALVVPCRIMVPRHEETVGAKAEANDGSSTRVERLNFMVTKKVTSRRFLHILRAKKRTRKQDSNEIFPAVLT